MIYADGYNKKNLLILGLHIFKKDDSSYFFRSIN